MDQRLDPIGFGLLAILFGLLLYSSVIAYRGIDFSVLKRMEASPLILPTPAVKP